MPFNVHRLAASVGYVLHLTKVHKAKGAAKFIFALLADEQKQALTF